MGRAKLLYLHGKEGACEGTKGRYLRGLGKYDVCCEHYDTGSRGDDWRDFLPNCVEVSRQAIQKHNPDLIIGSSFGGGVLLSLVQKGLWTGPCIFLAGAGIQYGMMPVLPENQPVILIHGTEDFLIPLEDSIRLTRSSQTAKLIAIHDEHRLSRLVTETNILEQAIDELLC